MSQAYQGSCASIMACIQGVTLSSYWERFQASSRDTGARPPGLFPQVNAVQKSLNQPTPPSLGLQRVTGHLKN